MIDLIISHHRISPLPPYSFTPSFITGSIARSARRRNLVYSEADFHVFRPQGRHGAPIGWNLAWRRGTCNG